MQNLNWNDLRYLLAVKRGQSLANAAKLMSVDATTASRRLTALSAAVGDDLYFRKSNGHLELTETGQAVIANIENMETEVDQLCTQLDNHSTKLTGSVRITSLPIIINRMLVPSLKEFVLTHPELQINLVPDSRNLSLNFRETDIALRLARPVSGGSDTLTRRIGNLDYGIYSPTGLSKKEASELPWIGYDDDLAHVSTAQWISKTSSKIGEVLSPIKVQDTETIIEAIASGLGKSLLPISVAKSIKALERLDIGEPAISREIWLLVHRNQSKTNRITKVIEWLETVLQN